MTGFWEYRHSTSELPAGRSSHGMLGTSGPDIFSFNHTHSFRYLLLLHYSGSAPTILPAWGTNKITKALHIILTNWQDLLAPPRILPGKGVTRICERALPSWLDLIDSQHQELFTRVANFIRVVQGDESWEERSVKSSLRWSLWRIM